jgi:hypothetical protein
LSIIAVVRTDETLGDMRYQPRHGKASSPWTRASPPNGGASPIPPAPQRQSPLRKSYKENRSRSERGSKQFLRDGESGPVVMPDAARGKDHLLETEFLPRRAPGRGLQRVHGAAAFKGAG